MSAILFAFVSLIGWGIGDVFTTYSSRKIGSYNTSFYGYAFGAVLASLYVPFALVSVKDLSLPMFLLSFGLAIIQLLAFLAFNEGLRIGNSSLVGTIAGSFTSLVVIFSLVFLGERLSTAQFIPIVLIFIGLFL